jgi:benzoyl-CoA reductase/2-hydroxyglutaryl-CoA dehydratase subunit BcrC/BadD/HgdB
MRIMISSNHSSVVAYFDSSHDMPEELIMAAEFIPFKILGDVHSSTGPADKFLFETFCPASRSILTEALNSSQKWEGIILAHGCDATHRHFDIWRKHVDNPFISFINNPLSRKSKNTKKYYRTELESFIQRFQEHFNVKITSEKLREAISLSNQIKKMLQELGNLRAIKDIPNGEYFDVCRRALQEDKRLLISSFQKILEEWKNYSDFPSDYSRILLTGSDITYVAFLDILEKAKLRVVRDDLSVGERYFASLIPDLEDPIDSLIEYQYLIPRPATKHPVEPRLDFLLNAYESARADGIISQNLKFCEPYAFDSVWLSDSFKKRGILALHLERDYTSEDQQLFTRLEAFKELLDSRRRG